MKPELTELIENAPIGLHWAGRRTPTAFDENQSSPPASNA
jgi:hypothetical protein